MISITDKKMTPSKKRTLEEQKSIGLHKKNVRSVQHNCNICAFTSEYCFELDAHYRTKHHTPYCPLCEVDDPLASCPFYQQEKSGKVKICYE